MRFYSICLLAAAASSLWGAAPGFPGFFVSHPGGSALRFTFNQPGEMASFDPAGVVFGGPEPVRLEFLGGSPFVTLEGASPLPGKANFLLNNQPESWRTNVPLYQAVRYRQLWPGIDLVYRFTGGKLKSEFEVAPGADPARIRWRYSGRKADVTGPGALRVSSAARTLLEEESPVSFQGAVTVATGFQLERDGTVHFSLSSYDSTKPLVIDPAIVFGTYFGGSGQSAVTAIAHDSGNSAIFAGWTTSLDITPGAFANGAGGSADVFVAKLNAAGNQVSYCTYLGGSGDDRAYGLALDNSNEAYVTGATTSRNFPVVSPYQARFSGSKDAFAAKLNSNGSVLLWSTYLGGSDVDAGNAIAVDLYGNAYITGDTRSGNFPVVGPFQNRRGGGQDVFYTKLNSNGAMVFSSYLGGGLDEHASGIAVDSSGNLYLAGGTFSNNFPVANAWQPASGGNQDAFVAKINSYGSGLVFSTYLGGSGGTTGLNEQANAIALDTAGNVYVAGQTGSINFPTSAGAFQRTSNGQSDAFAAKFTSSGALSYCTLLSGSSLDVGNALAVDFGGNAYVAGYTASQDFPRVNALQNANNGTYNVFLSKLNNTGSALIYGTYLGGSGIDSANAVAVDAFGNVLVGGQTFSTDFPTLNGYQSYPNGSQSGFVMKLASSFKPAVFNGGQWQVDYLRNGGTDGHVYTLQTGWFGIPGDIPVFGDWTNTGQMRMGTFRPSNGTWYLDMNGNGQWDGSDRTFQFGQNGDLPVVGDWNGSGTTKAGLFRQGTWILDYSGHLSGVPTGQPDLTGTFGQAGDLAVVGDWTGTGRKSVGVFRPGTATWYIDVNGSLSLDSGDWVFPYGLTTDTPLTGDWDGSGITRFGLWRNGTWLLDANGNHQVDGPGGGDISFTFGPPSWVPLMAK